MVDWGGGEVWVDFIANLSYVKFDLNQPSGWNV